MQCNVHCNVPRAELDALLGFDVCPTEAVPPGSRHALDLGNVM